MLHHQQGGSMHPCYFGRRRGRRMRKARAALLETLLPRLAIKLPQIATSSETMLGEHQARIFAQAEGSTSPLELFDDKVSEVWLEIGFGSGEHLAEQAERHPEIGMIGCEPFLSGVARLVSTAAERGLSNIRILADDARLLLPYLTQASIGRCFILFSDPWPKYRHRKRRFISPESVHQLARILKEGSVLQLASDQPVLLRWIMECLWRHPEFAWQVEDVRSWQEPPSDWIPTRYQRKALAESRRPVYLNFVRRPQEDASATQSDIRYVRK